MNNYLPLSGGTMTDSIITVTSDGSPAIRYFDRFSGTRGGELWLFERNSAYHGGAILRCHSKDGVSKDFVLTADGVCAWGGKAIALDDNVVHKSGEETIGGIKTFSNTISMIGNIAKSSDNSALILRGSTSDNNGARLGLYGKDHENKGNFYIHSNDGTSSKILRGSASEDSLQWGGREIDRIDSQGDGYIRYSNGLQVCFKQYIANANANTAISLPKPFINTDFMITLTSYGDFCSITQNSTNIAGFSISNSNTNDLHVNVISIGKWK